MKDLMTIYRGYYQSNLLAVSTDKQILKTYLKETRRLSSNEYYIQKSKMDSDNAYALYDEFMLEEYLKDLYLPARDCSLLDKEIQDYFNDAVNTLNQMRNYLRSIQGIDILEKHAIQLKETIHNMEEDLTTKKVLKRMKKRVIKTSKLLSSDINTYCKTLNYKNELKELDRMYLDRLYDSKS